jgi:DNA-binding GntR family transcriptional regulator
MTTADQRAVARGPMSRGARNNVAPSGLPATASDYATNEIRDAILSGTLALGSRLDQQVLAEQIGVSTIPIREALRKLEADGLVRIDPRRGAYVAELSAHEQLEISRIRERLEDLATRLAVKNLDADRLERLTDIAAQMAAASDEGQSSTWRELNREWHFTLYEAARSPILQQLIIMLRDRSSLYRALNAARPDHREKSNREHQEVLHRLQERNAAGAARAIRNHIRRAAKETLTEDDGNGA